MRHICCHLAVQRTCGSIKAHVRSQEPPSRCKRCNPMDRDRSAMLPCRITCASLYRERCTCLRQSALLQWASIKSILSSSQQRCSRPHTSVVSLTHSTLKANLANRHAVMSPCQQHQALLGCPKSVQCRTCRVLASSQAQCSLRDPDPGCKKL